MIQKALYTQHTNAVNGVLPASLDGAPVRPPLKEETAWERAQHEKFRARWGSDPFKDAEKLTAQNFSGKSPG